MKKILLVLFLLPLFLSAQTEDKTTYTKVGQNVPAFSVTTLDGKTINIADLKGKVVLLNFFATWCGPCMLEMPVVEKEIWQKYKGDNFVVLALGREHSKDELEKFNKEKGFTFLIAPDPKRGVYSLFAKETIPRNYLINKEGKIIWQGIGYSKEEFAKLIVEIEKAIKN
jgi:peroxiredoxin